jgi:threonine synthase
MTERGHEGSATNVSALRCVRCNRRYAEGEVLYTCPDCGVAGILDVEYDYDRIEWKPSDDRSIWRYAPLLPLVGAAIRPSLQIGWTPVAEFPRLASLAGLAQLHVKDDGRNPSGSFKDRASAVGVVKAGELGHRTIACSSTGNAASSLACMCANLGLEAILFVPASAPDGKIAQLRGFGAKVLLVEGTYDQAYNLCEAAVGRFGWYNRNCAVNPYLIEGKKTCGLEVGEQMASTPPDVVAVAVGDGCTIGGIWKGMKEMHRFGVLPRLPRLLGVQASGAAPLVDAWTGKVEAGTAAPEALTIADSIAVREPRNWWKALAAVRESEGALIAVSDDAIVEAAYRIGASTGIFVEPSAAAAFAGIVAARGRGLIERRDRVLYVATGTGLKDIRGATARAPQPTRVGLSLADVEQACSPQSVGPPN